MSNGSQEWTDHFLKMGNFRKSRKFYTVTTSRQSGAGPVQLVTPTEQQVDQARMKLKRKSSSQTAGKRCNKRRKTDKKKSSVKKRQSGSKRKGRSTKRTSAKKKTTKKRKSK